MNTDLTTKLLHTEESSVSEELFLHRFQKIVIGQPDAERIALTAHNAINNPLRDHERPIGIYFLAGPSRTGKSLTAEALAELVHGDRKALIRIQASDYMNDGQLLDLKGAPPMYTGYQDPTDKKNAPTESDVDPTSVISAHNLRRVRLGSQSQVDIIVIEEFEKGCADFYKLFMGIFDKGRLLLGNGLTVDFTNAIFVLTSNLGMAELERLASRRPMGFQAGAAASHEKPSVRAVVQHAMRQHFPPEFRNRLDAVVIYEELTGNRLMQIVDAELAKVQARIDKRLGRNTFTLDCDLSARLFLLERATADGGSVAELTRVIGRHVTEALGRELGKGSIAAGDRVLVSHEQGAAALSFSTISLDGRRAYGGASGAEVQEQNTIAASSRVSSRRSLERRKDVSDSFARELQIAELSSAESGGSNEQCLTIAGAQIEQVYDAAYLLEDELHNLFRLPIESSRIDHASLTATFAIKASARMIRLIQSRHPLVVVAAGACPLRAELKR